jgi:hypothetical protein
MRSQVAQNRSSSSVQLRAASRSVESAELSMRHEDCIA